MGIIGEGDVRHTPRAAKVGVSVEPIGRLNMAKKSKKRKRSAPARKKKRMRKTKKPAPKSAPVPTVPPAEQIP